MLSASRYADSKTDFGLQYLFTLSGIRQIARTLVASPTSLCFFVSVGAPGSGVKIHWPERVEEKIRQRSEVIRDATKKGDPEGSIRLRRDWITIRTHVGPRTVYCVQYPKSRGLAS